MVTVFGYHFSLTDLKLALWHALIFFLAFCIPAVAGSLTYLTPDAATSQPLQLLGNAAIFAGLISASTLAFGLDSRSLESKGSAFTLRLALGVLVGGAMLLLLAPSFPDISGNQERVLVSLAIAFLATLATRHLAAGFVAVGSPLRRVIIVGTGNSAARVGNLIASNKQRRYECIGFYRAGSAPCGSQISESTVFDNERSLSDLATENNVHEIVVALDDRRGALPIDSLLTAKLRGIEVTDLVSFYERECFTIKFEQLHPSWIIFSNDFRLGSGKRFAKRAFDVAASLTMLAVTSPLLLIVMAASLVESRGRGPIFYSQVRVGCRGREFRLHKFRSMKPDAEVDGRARWACADDARVTKLGKYLRRFRIDELPQLYNILVGDMSLVGPRPERPEFVRDLGAKIPFYNERHCVPPGLTGWAQLMYPYGANTEDAKRKLEYDLYYIKHTSVAWDFVILLRTFEVVVSGRGVR